jgi:hypothetical protein
LGLVVYYSYVLFCYYGSELRLWITGRRARLSGPVAQLEGEGTIEEALSGAVGQEQIATVRRSAGGAVLPAEGQQASLFPADPGQQVDQDPDRVTDKAIGAVNATLNAAKGSPITREEIAERLCSVLEGYGELKDTQHQETINQIIQRACTYLFNIRLEAEALQKLWR